MSELLRALIGAQRDGEAAVQRVFAEAARALGCVVEARRYRPEEVPMVGEFASTCAIDGGERESVVATLKGRGGGRSLILFAHPDSEPVAGTERWRRDPFAAAVEGGRLHGWGVADDLAGVALMVDGLGTALGAGQPKGDVVLASTPSKRHARGVSALLHGGLRADAALYLHPAESGVGLREIKAFCLGELDFRITVQGRPPATNEISHLAFAHDAENPADLLWHIQGRLRELGERRAATLRHPLLGRSANLLVSHVAVGASGVHARVPLAGVIEGALSLLPGESLATVQAELAAAVGSAARLDWVSGVSGAEVPLDSPLYRAVAQAIVAVTGEVTQVNPLHTASDIRNPIVQAGMPTVGLGPRCGDLTQNGCTDEWVDLDDYRRATEVVAGIVGRWCA